jgi:predicted ATPase
MHIRKVTLHPESYPTRECYPFNLPLFQQTRSVEFVAPVTIFAGENGTGKSTLLRAICRRCGVHIWEPEHGRRVHHNPYEDELYTAVEVEWVNGSVPGAFFGSETFKHFASTLEEWASSDPGQLGYFGGRSLLTQSHGQSLMSYFRARYQIEGLYFLDEPETALSPRSQLELLEILADMGQAGHAQFVVATHSPILMACQGACIYSFDSIPIRRVEYEQTEHYRIYREFMADRRKYM